MCDTMGFFSNGTAIFAKNSDRSPNEPQVLEYIPAADHSEAELRVTYTTIPQVAHTKAVLISRPCWLWGAEMGVNEDGVCIGNEAVFSKGAYHKENDTLIGMDLLRLGLERGGSAREAMQVIIDLLEEYGQGGNCAYDHKFYYDNSFLIMDRLHIFILETAGTEWFWQEVERGSISNRLELMKPYRDVLYTTFSGSKARLGQTAGCLAGAATVQDMMKALRTHAPGVTNPFARPTVGSVCMHYGGLVGDHSTASMIVELSDDITVWLTGTSTPCVSVFKPWKFGTAPVMPVYAGTYGPAADNTEYWCTAEVWRRALIGKAVPADFFAARDALEQELLQKAAHTSADGFAALTAEAVKAEEDLYAKFPPASFEKAESPMAYRRRWQKKTKVLLNTPPRLF